MTIVEPLKSPAARSSIAAPPAPARRPRFQYSLPALMLFVFVASVAGAIFGGMYRAQASKQGGDLVFYVWLITLAPLGVAVLVSVVQPIVVWLRKR